jgi:flagella basal body P-ring formation protein FlgA
MRPILAFLLVGLALRAASPEVELSPLERLQTDAVSYAEAQAADLKGTFVFRVARPPMLPRVPPGAKITFQADHLSRRELGGAFFVSFRMLVDGRPLGQVRVDLEGTWTGKLLRAQCALPRKDVPLPDQLQQVDFEGSPPAGAVDEFPDGYRLRSPVPAGHILVMQDLETIPVVQSGDQVRVEVVSGPLTIALQAVARGNGAVGEKVRLELLSSHKSLQAVVSGPGEARVQWAGEN